MTKTEKLIKTSIQEHIDATKDCLKQWVDLQEKAEKAMIKMKATFDALEKATLESEAKIEKEEKEVNEQLTKEQAKLDEKRKKEEEQKLY
jgi:hypothetical protein